MTSHRDPWLACDVTGPNCEGQYPEDAGDSAFVDGTIRGLRAAAKTDGWIATRDGRDICPVCQGTRDRSARHA